MHPVLGPVTYSASEPVPATNSGQSSPHSDTGTDVSPHDLIDEASDEIPRLTRLYADQTSEQDPLNTFARLHRVLLTDTHTDVSDLALIYGPMTQQASTAEDIKTLQLQCAGLLARVEALEPLNEPTTHIPYPRDKQCARGYQKNIKQRSREQREARRDKIHLHI